MNPGTPLGINVTHNVGNINDAIGFFPKAWRATKKYSVNNTIPIVVVNAWLQFSLAYVAAVVVTSHDMSFITNILNSRAMPAYALASVILGTILLTSLIIKHAHKQEIKDEILKNGKNTIDIKIRGGESDGINEIAQNALTIEIVPDTSLIGNKKENFSIVLPISGKQGEILENKRQENRNKIVLLTVPYVLSGLTVVGALAKFGFANIQSWKQWTFIAAVGVIAIVGACITLSKLRNNEVDNACNTVKKFDNADILLPCRKGSVISVMENKFESKEENDPLSRLIKLFDRHLTNLVNRVCYLFDNSLLKPSNVNIKGTLDGMKKDVATLLDKLKEIIKQNLDGVEATANEAIIQCLVNIDKSVDELCKGVGEKVQNELDKISIKDLVDNISRLAETLEDRVARTKPGRCTGLAGATFAEERLPNAPRESRDDQLSQQDQGIQTNNSEKPDVQRVDWAEGVKEIGQLKKKIEALKRALEEKESNQTQADSGVNSETSSTTSNDPQRDEEEILDEELARLEKEERMEEKREKIKNLKEARPKQKEIKEWKKEINGKPSEFLYYVLESIKLGEKATLRNLHNKIIIHWKEGSQTICHIKKQGNLQIEPSAAMFKDPSVQAAWEMVRG
ncbi:MAG: hypothetical protein PG978_001222 [Wolbachia endosymbiont of Ctenocephalides felis wCfeF]|nr:MAG: hypothetical protein PG978_001222 [Wolbachia endosymbiont of Ctenocephalides felis wCfeF]